jgi:aprataxin
MPKWNQSLVRIASAANPNHLPTLDRVLFWDDRTITIYDAFAKAKYHFLVLPRLPFRSAAPRSDAAAPALKAAGGKLSLGSTSSNIVPASHMRSVSDLMASPYAAEVLEAVRVASEKVVEFIRKDMLQQYDTEWAIERAFHAVPSMDHLHLHVISMDLVSDRLKHKKHYLSFHPDVGFALRLEYIEELVRKGKSSLPRPPPAYEELLKGELCSHHTGQTFRFMPEIKAHLDAYWRMHTLVAHPGAHSHLGGDCEPAAADCKRQRSRPPSDLSAASDQTSDTDCEVSLPLK